LTNWALLLAFFLFWQSPDQSPPLGVIDFYGLRTVTEAQVRQALGTREGDTIDINQLEKWRHETEKRIEAIPGVETAFLNLGCCTPDGKSTLYVGIQEKNTTCMTFSAAPQGSVRLTDDIVRAGADFQAALEKAVVSGDASEDDSKGYAWNHNAAVRAVELRFLALAKLHLDNLKEVLRHSGDAEQRALAAQVLGYAADRQSVAQDLIAATHDPSPGVRNNATRALMVFAGYAHTSAGANLHISAQPFIEMLNSCIWTDRNKSSFALAELTETRDAALLAEIRREALASLLEMAEWKLMGHAQPSLLILGRIGGLSEEQIEKDIEANNRQAILVAAKNAK